MYFILHCGIVGKLLKCRITDWNYLRNERKAVICLPCLFGCEIKSSKVTASAVQWCKIQILNSKMSNWANCTKLITAPGSCKPFPLRCNYFFTQLACLNNASVIRFAHRATAVKGKKLWNLQRGDRDENERKKKILIQLTHKMIGHAETKMLQV